MEKNKSFITGEMLVRYYELNKQKKEIDQEMSELKEAFQNYFNNLVGLNCKGEVVISGYKLQRQVRTTEKYNEDVTVKRLEELQMNDLIQVLKKPDSEKIKAALKLGFLKHNQLEDCLTINHTPAISVKPLTPR